MFAMRPGTSGIHGQLFETKLISLLAFRAKHNRRIREIFLATNVDEVGHFDDICFRAYIDGLERPVVACIQVRHRENNKKRLLSPDDIALFFDSYLKIRRNFKPDNKNVLFEGEYDETECLFILYTNGDYINPNKEFFSSSCAKNVNDLINTGDEAKQITLSDENIEFLCNIALKDQIATLADRMSKYISRFKGKGKVDPVFMVDEYVQRFHVALAQEVLDISDIVRADGCRRASFRREFFDTNNELLVFFRKSLYKSMHGHLQRYLQYEERRRMQLEDEEMIKEILMSLVFNMPAAFGNKDLHMKEKRLRFLSSKIIDLIEHSAPSKIITIDESMEAGFLRGNGGIAGAVGNVLVSDENTKLMKFTNDHESLGPLAKQLYYRLHERIENMHEYKFDVKVDNFPRMSLTSSTNESHLARDFLSKLVLYTNQGDEKCIEMILKSEIEDHLWNDYVNNFKLELDNIFLKYHDAVQKWWMIPKTREYLTNESQIYENAIQKFTQ